jgi:chromate reductase, NAD(P)H dehydrogenase (quinone)
MIRIVGISGSLREQSSNSALLRAAATVAPEGIAVELYRGLGDLPHFNPDHEADPPATVLALHDLLTRADGFVVSTPEYAHGVPGSLKNGLDWLVGTTALSGKPFALFNASARAAIAQASLVETLKTMDARHIPDATLTLPLLGQKLDDAAIAAHAEWTAQIAAALTALARACGVAGSAAGSAVRS